MLLALAPSPSFYSLCGLVLEGNFVWLALRVPGALTYQPDPFRAHHLLTDQQSLESNSQFQQLLSRCSLRLQWVPVGLFGRLRPRQHPWLSFAFSSTMWMPSRLAVTVGWPHAPIFRVHDHTLSGLSVDVNSRFEEVGVFFPAYLLCLVLWMCLRKLQDHATIAISPAFLRLSVSAF